MNDKQLAAILRATHAILIMRGFFRAASELHDVIEDLER